MSLRVRLISPLGHHKEVVSLWSRIKLTPLLPVWAELEAARPKAVTTGVTRSTNQSQSSKDEEPRRQKQSRLEDRKLGKKKRRGAPGESSPPSSHTGRRVPSLL